MPDYDKLERQARELCAEVPLSAEDITAIVAQAQAVLAAIAELDELPLDQVEPDFQFRSVP